MKTGAIFAMSAALAAPLAAGDNQFSVADFQGGFYSVTNRYNGANDYVHVKRLTPEGYLAWQNYRNPVGMDLRASAIAVDPAAGGLYVAAVRGRGERSMMTLLRFSQDGSLEWERDFNEYSRNIPSVAMADRDGNLFIGGRVKRDNRSIARVWKADRWGAFQWYRDYEEYGNTFVTQVQVGARGEAIVGVEVMMSDNMGGGQYVMRTVIYDSNGGRVSVQ
jgi:hypothetical protein